MTPYHVTNSGEGNIRTSIPTRQHGDIFENKQKNNQGSEEKIKGISYQQEVKTDVSVTFFTCDTRNNDSLQSE